MRLSPCDCLSARTRSLRGGWGVPPEEWFLEECEVCHSHRDPPFGCTRTEHRPCSKFPNFPESRAKLTRTVISTLYFKKATNLTVKTELKTQNVSEVTVEFSESSRKK